MKRPVFFKAILLLLLVSFLLSVSTTAYALEKNGSGYTVVDKRDYPIIFIPGIASSTLDTADGVNEWPGSFSSQDLARLQQIGLVQVGVWQSQGWGLPGEIVNDEAFRALALDKDGRNPLPPDGKRVRPTGTVRYGAEQIAGTLISGAVKSTAIGVPIVGPLASYFVPAVVGACRVSAI